MMMEDISRKCRNLSILIRMSIMMINKQEVTLDPSNYIHITILYVRKSMYGKKYDNKKRDKINIIGIPFLV